MCVNKPLIDQCKTTVFMYSVYSSRLVNDISSIADSYPFPRVNTNCTCLLSTIACMDDRYTKDSENTARTARDSFIIKFIRNLCHQQRC